MNVSVALHTLRTNTCSQRRPTLRYFVVCSTQFSGRGTQEGGALTGPGKPSRDRPKRSAGRADGILLPDEVRTLLSFFVATQDVFILTIYS